MKRLAFVLVLVLLITFGSFGQTFDEVEGAFDSFASDLSAALPFASTIGLNWSDTYIGQFPHLGAGLVVGAVGLPVTAFDTVLQTLTNGAASADLLNTLPPELQPYIKTFGMPFPSVDAEARLGGFGIPFDIGLKVGLIPNSVDISSLVPGLDAN